MVGRRVTTAARRTADTLLITCEHGGNDVPSAYSGLFHRLRAPLKTHRGFDAGALIMARELAAALQAPLVFATVTRLLVDLNRSIGHPRLHADTVRDCPPEVRQRIVADHYAPYRQQVESLVRSAIACGRRVIHVSSHSFTPELDGEVRTADIGLLYDPARAGEARLCADWKAGLARATPALRVRRNYPYLGTGDGFMPHLRSRHSASTYVGVELEINQAIVFSSPRFAQLRATLIATLRAALAAQEP